jgi:hypothetical protein
VRAGTELTDEDLARLARLGGAVEQIAEAAGIDPGQVLRRLEAVERWTRTQETGRQTAARLPGLVR